MATWYRVVWMETPSERGGRTIRLSLAFVVSTRVRRAGALALRGGSGRGCSCYWFPVARRLFVLFFVTSFFQITLTW